jgi:hypothetical protein
MPARMRPGSVEPMSRSAVYRLPGVVALAALGGGGVYAAHQAEQQFHETSDMRLAAPRQTLLLLTHSGDVEIAPGPGRAIHIVRRAHWVGSKPTHAVDVRPGSSERVELTDHCPGGVESATALFAFHTACGVSYRVSVPVGQSVFVTVESGDIRLKNLRGKLIAVNQSGDIDATGLRAWNVQLSSQSGDVSASFTRAPTSLEAGSASGDVSLRVPAGRYRINATTNSGDRSVDRISDDLSSGHRIEAHTSSGDVSIGRSDG